MLFSLNLVGVKSILNLHVKYWKQPLHNILTPIKRIGTVVSLNPFQMLDLQSKKIAISIRDLEKLKYLYQPNRSIAKDEAFGKFYEVENGQTAVKNPYVDIIPTIPDGENSNGSSTPVPQYDGSRYSQGSLPGLSPISYEQSHSPFFLPPSSPPTTSMSSFHTVQSPGSATTMYV